MNARELASKYNMAEHPENGAFLERHYENPSDCGRAASGSIYYYVAPGEKTKFHKIDCDEYWCYTAGSDLEVWLIDESAGTLSVENIGTGPNANPFVYVKKGMIFASRHSAVSDFEDGTFLVCITVPRFTYEGFTLLEDSEVIARFPKAATFYS